MTSRAMVVIRGQTYASDNIHKVYEGEQLDGLLRAFRDVDEAKRKIRERELTRRPAH